MSAECASTQPRNITNDGGLKSRYRTCPTLVLTYRYTVNLVGCRNTRCTLENKHWQFHMQECIYMSVKMMKKKRVAECTPAA